MLNSTLDHRSEILTHTVTSDSMQESDTNCQSIIYYVLYHSQKA